MDGLHKKRCLLHSIHGAKEQSESTLQCSIGGHLQFGIFWGAKGDSGHKHVKVQVGSLIALLWKNNKKDINMKIIIVLVVDLNVSLNDIYFFQY